MAAVSAIPAIFWMQLSVESSVVGVSAVTLMHIEVFSWIHSREVLSAAND